MTDDFDLELLRRLRPPTDGPDRALVQRERNALMAVIQQAPEPTPSHPPRRRRARWTVPGVVLALGVTTAAGWAMVSSDADNTVAFACVADEGRVTSVLPNDGTSPIDACARAWESGSMVQGVTQAPPLTACVSSTGVVTVIEATGEQSCEAARMAPWEDLADFEAVGQAVRSVRVAFHDRHAVTGDGCAEESEWRDLLQAELRDHGTTDWTIEVDQIEPDRHCYDVSDIVPSSRTIVLMGTPGEHSIGCDPRTGC
ncbi:MAG TPA: hypothetical protein VGV93_03095 [Acidimicrobiales bacterium]|nr:hypothetical protein [Acidimicrobiales bacterium]